MQSEVILIVFKNVWYNSNHSIAKTQSGTASSALTLDGTLTSSNTFTDNAGKRISITSAGGNESAYGFTVVGTDLSGNAQTEVITGPTNGTVIGTKTFRTVTSLLLQVIPLGI